MGNGAGIPPDAVELALMGQAIDLAEHAAAAGEVPIGAIIVDQSGTVIGRGSNQRKTAFDPSAHAEIIALRDALRARQEHRLVGCTLVVTVEPCVMCAGAILASQLARVVFGAWEAKTGASGSVYDILRDGRLPHPVPEVIPQVRAEECSALLQNFFTQKRQQ
jgi:tRNA(adenine34) deaminase